MLTRNMVSGLPSRPGVYFFKGKSEEILYIGKAKTLSKRVQSYLHNNRRNRRYKMRQLVRHTIRVDYQICASELEALLLEARLIKKYQPKYNTALKAVYALPFIRIAINDPFPRVELADDEKQDGARYFGPFSARRWTWEVIDMLHKIFPIRTCDGKIAPEPNFRPCFSYHVRRCDAPCAGRVSQADYRAMIDDVMRILDGEYPAVIADLRRARAQAATELRFERAGAIQKKIEQIEKVFVYIDVHGREEAFP